MQSYFHAIKKKKHCTVISFQFQNLLTQPLLVMHGRVEQLLTTLKWLRRNAIKRSTNGQNSPI